MKLREVHIDGFGVWSGLTLAELSPECTVFYGPNEAGKTTVLQFIRAVLYGFSTDRTSRYLPPLRGGSAGGTLGVITPSDGRLTVRRRINEIEPLGEVFLKAADRSVSGESHLHSLLNEIDESTFHNIFAVGLQELQELATLSDSDAAQWLYSLTSGLDRVSLCDVLRELQNSRARILPDDTNSGQIGGLLVERQRLRRELQELADLPQQYERLVSQQAGCEEAIAQAGLSVSELEGKHRAWEAASLVYDTWHRRNLLNAQIEAFGSDHSWPANALLRMDRLSSTILKGRQRIRRLRKQRQKLSVEVRAVSLNEALGRQSARIAALAENEAWIVAVEQELGAAEVTVKSLVDQQQNQQQQFVSTANFNAPVPQQLDLQVWQTLRKPAAVLSKTRRQLKAAKRLDDKQRETLGNRRREIESAMSALGKRDLKAAVEASGQKVSQLRRRIQLDDQADQLAHLRSELEERITVLQERQILPPWTLVGLGALFVIGAVLALAGLFLPASFTGSLGWPMAVLGVLGIGSAVAAKYLLERNLAGQLAASQRQLEQAQQQAEQVETERAELDRSLPKETGTLAARLQTAEQELTQLEQLLPLDAQRQAAELTANEAEARNETARAKFEAALRHWRTVLANAGLPDRLTPRQVRDMTAVGAQLVGMENRLGDARSDLERCRRELAALANRIEQIFLSAGIKPESPLASQQLRQLRRVLAEEEGRQQRRDHVRRNRRRLRRRQTAIEERLQRLRRRRKSLLKDCDVADVGAFRRRAAESARIAALIGERDAAGREIASLLAGCASESAIAAIVTDKSSEQLESELAQINEQLKTARVQQRRLFEQRGLLSEQLLQLAGDRRPAIKRFELGQIEERLSALTNRWQVLSVTQSLMEDIKTDYERNRQPETLREASRYLAQLTQGHYRRVWTPFGESRLLVDDAEGRSIPVEVLSRGTREQLFLSLRLALVALFARRGAPLPMVLDDVLVNFDADRAAAAVAVLRDFAAAGHQLLVFTCHEHIARLFKAHAVDVRRLPDNKSSGRDLPFEPDRAPSSPIRSEPAVFEPEPSSEPEVRQIELLRIATAQSNFGDMPQMIEVSIQPPTPNSNVDVHYIYRPELMPEEPAAQPQLEPPPPLVVKRRRPKLRLDPPQPAVRVMPIRRRWAAEEFSGELDDRINPLWLLNGTATPSQVEMVASDVAEAGILTRPVVADRRIRTLKQFEDEPVPVVIEVIAGDEDWDM